VAANPQLAVTATTYYGFADVYIDLEQGSYYTLIDINQVGVLAGAVVTALVTNMLIHFIDEGKPVLPGQGEKLEVGLRTLSTGFDITSVKEAAVMSATELSVTCNALSFDEDFSPTMIAFMEEEANLKLEGAAVQIAASLGVGSQYTLPIIDPQDRTGLIPLYAFFKTSYMRQTLHIVTAAPTTIAYGVAF
jgi:hypothetical protein